MNDRMENKLSMYLAVKEVLEAHREVWRGMPALSRAIDRFYEQLLTLNILRAEQEASTKGAAMSKRDRKAALIRAALAVTSKVKAYAHETGNRELAETVRYSRSDLEDARDTTLMNICQMLYEKTAPHVKAMAEYQLTDAEMSGLQAATAAYEEVLQKPREAISKRKSSGQALTAAMKETDALLKGRIDELVKTFRETHAEAVQTYLNARRIVEHGQRKASAAKGEA